MKNRIIILSKDQRMNKGILNGIEALQCDVRIPKNANELAEDLGWPGKTIVIFDDEDLFYSNRKILFADNKSGNYEIRSIVVISAKNIDSTINLFALGASEVLLRPFNLEDMLSSIQTLLPSEYLAAA